MAIIFDLVKSYLSNLTAEVFMPKTFADGSHDLDSVSSSISNVSTVRLSDVRAVLTNLEEFLIRELSNGRSIHLGWCYLHPQVKGSFEDPMEPFTKGKHSIEVSITPSAELLKAVAIGAMPRKIDNPKTAPIPKKFRNDTSESMELVVAGDMVSIQGSFLRFDRSNPEEGVFLEADGNIKLRAIKYSRVSEKEVIFQIPQGIELGTEYNFVVYKKFGSEVRLGKLNKPVVGA